MTIPEKLQLWPKPVRLSDKDAERLTPYLRNWRLLVVNLQEINEPDLQRLLVMELLDERRWRFVTRLLMRLGRIERMRLESRVRRMCK